MQCSVEGCGRPVRARGWCFSHYTRWSKGDLMADVPIGGIKVTPETRKKLSESHKGLPQSPEAIAKRSISIKEAWKNRADRKPAGFINGGYRIIGAKPDHPLAGPKELAEHRKVLYEAIGSGSHGCHWCGRMLEWGGIQGIIPDHINGDTLDNRAENLVPSCTSCNMRRGRAGNPPDWSSEVTHCPHGHEYSAENTYVYRNTRQCRECKRERTRQWRQKQKVTSCSED